MPFTDVTSGFRDAVKSLKIGEMVTSSKFALDEAMSSIELMEPKMDSGYNSEERDIHVAAARESVCLTDLSDLEQARVSDILIGELYNWLNGHLYIQTVHASLFMIERSKLQNQCLGAFCSELMQSCSTLREFVSMTGVCSEEDFIGYMFHLDDDDQSSPQILPPSDFPDQMGLRFEFIRALRQCLRETATFNIHQLLSKVDSFIRVIDSILKELPNPSFINQDLINTDSIQRSFHKDLLPSGPPRVVPAVLDSITIYSNWRTVAVAMKKVCECVSLGDTVDRSHESAIPKISAIRLIHSLSEARNLVGFSYPLVRAFLYHRLYLSVPLQRMCMDWMNEFCGGVDIEHSVDQLKNVQLKESWNLFLSDIVTVFGKLLHSFCKSPSRQHRNMDYVLSDLFVMQNRAWELADAMDQAGGATKGKPKQIGDKGSNRKSKTRPDAVAKRSNFKGMWSFVVVLGTYMIETHIALSIGDLQLVDKSNFHEISIMFYLLKKTVCFKLYALDAVIEYYAGHPIPEDIQLATMVGALTQSLCNCVENMVKGWACLDEVPMDEVSLERLYELRSNPLRWFVLPFDCSFENYLEERKTQCDVSEIPLRLKNYLTQSTQWIDQLSKRFPGCENFSGICSDLNGLKKSLVQSKVALMKLNMERDGVKPTTPLTPSFKYHSIVPCLV